jgi:hypothetical protein
VAAPKLAAERYADSVTPLANLQRAQGGRTDKEELNAPDEKFSRDGAGAGAVRKFAPPLLVKSSLPIWTVPPSGKFP